MLTLSPALFSTGTTGWPLDQDSISQDQNYFFRDHSETYTYESYFHPNNKNNNNNNNNNIITPSLEQHVELDHSTPSTGISGDLSMVKKENHNASERDRRKKINHLYSSLRSLLPPSQHKKKLSIPATISKVLHYIPELQQKVQGLTGKLEELLPKTSRLINNNKANPDIHDHENNIIEKKTMMKNKSQSSILSSSVSASQLIDREVGIQVSSYKGNEIQLSKILHILEEDHGLSILYASSFESFGGRVFHNLHLKVEEDYSVECEVLNEKLMFLYDNTDELLS